MNGEWRDYGVITEVPIASGSASIRRNHSYLFEFELMLLSDKSVYFERFEYFQLLGEFRAVQLSDLLLYLLLLQSLSEDGVVVRLIRSELCGQHYYFNSVPALSTRIGLDRFQSVFNSYFTLSFTQI